MLRQHRKAKRKKPLGGAIRRRAPAQKTATGSSQRVNREFILCLHSYEDEAFALRVNAEKFPTLSKGTILALTDPADEKNRRPLYLEVKALCNEVRGTWDITVNREIGQLYGFENFMTIQVRIVEANEGNLTSVELSFQDQYINRGETWRVTQELVGTGLYTSHKLHVNGVKAKVQQLRLKDKEVLSGVVGPKTKLFFRSTSALFHFLFQLSAEMWTYSEQGILYFEEALDGFCKTLFQKWREYRHVHVFSAIFFTRMIIDDQAQTSNSPEHVYMKDQSTGRLYNDYYQVVIDRSVSQDWSSIRKTLWTAFDQFPNKLNSMKPYGGSYTPSMAKAGNILEVINLCCNIHDKSFVDRNLNRTGMALVILTPGTGVFHVDRKLTRFTKSRVLINGIGADIVSINKPPLVPVPLFCFDAPLQSTSSSPTDWSKTAFCCPSDWVQIKFFNGSKKPLKSPLETEQMGSQEFYRIPLCVETPQSHDLDVGLELEECDVCGKGEILNQDNLIGRQYRKDMKGEHSGHFPNLPQWDIKRILPSCAKKVLVPFVAPGYNSKRQQNMSDDHVFDEHSDDAEEWIEGKEIFSIQTPWASFSPSVSESHGSVCTFNHISHMRRPPTLYKESMRPALDEIPSPWESFNSLPEASRWSWEVTEPSTINEKATPRSENSKLSDDSVGRVAALDESKPAVRVLQTEIRCSHDVESGALAMKGVVSKTNTDSVNKFNRSRPKNEKKVFNPLRWTRSTVLPVPCDIPNFEELLFRENQFSSILNRNDTGEQDLLWKSVICPARLPLTAKSSLREKLAKAKYIKRAPELFSLGKSTEKRTCKQLLDEFVMQRLTGDFQIMKPEVEPGQKTTIFDMCQENNIHRIVYNEEGYNIAITKWTKKWRWDQEFLKTKNTDPNDNKDDSDPISKNHYYHLWSYFYGRFILVQENFWETHEKPARFWSGVDRLCASSEEYEHQVECSKSKRIKFTLVPGSGTPDTTKTPKQILEERCINFKDWIATITQPPKAGPDKRHEPGKTMEEMRIKIYTREQGVERPWCVSRRVRIPLPRQWRDRFSWLWLSYDSVYDPETFFDIEISWLVASGYQLKSFVSTMRSASKSLGRIVQIPVYQSAIKQDPFNVNAQIKLQSSFISTKAQLDLVRLFNFLEDINHSTSSKQYRHLTCSCVVRVDSNKNCSQIFTWITNHLSEPPSIYADQSRTLFREVSEHIRRLEICTDVLAKMVNTLASAEANCTESSPQLEMELLASTRTPDGDSFDTGSVVHSKSVLVP